MRPRRETSLTSTPWVTEQFLAAMEGIEEAIYVADTTTYEILFLNRVGREQLGKDAVGTICYRTLQGREAPCPFCTNDIILREAPATYRWEHHNPVTGRTYDLHDRIIHWPDGRGVRMELAIDITDRKSAETALQESHDRYELILSGSAGGIWDWDVANHRIRFSSRWKSMRGFAHDDIGDTETEWTARIHPDDAARVMAAVTAHMSGQTDRFEQEYRVRRSDGSYMWVRDCGMAQRDATGKVIRMAGSQIDITESKREQDLLSQQLQLVEAILETTPGILVLKDQSGIYREVNPAFCRFLGKPRHAIVGKSDEELFPSDEAAACRAGDATVIETGTVESRDWIVTGAKGKRWLHVAKTPVRGTNGTITGVLSTAEDVTERKQAEIVLRENALLLSKSQEMGHIGSWKLDPRSNRLTWSDEVYRVFGCEPQEFAATYEDFLGFVHPGDRAAVEAAYAGSLRNGSDAYEIEHRIVRRATGEIRHVLERCVHERDAAGSVVQSLGMVQDITDTRLIETYLRAGTELLTLFSNRIPTLQDMAQQTVRILKMRTKLDAVGLRIRDGEDFPYYASEGLSREFVREENSLVARRPDGDICRNPDGSICLACTCGLVISGRIDPANPLFTSRGSCVANAAGQPTDPPASPDPRLQPRDRCLHEGYASVALIPIRAGEHVLGLLQFASYAQNSFPSAVVDILENLASSLGAAMARLRAEEVREQQAQKLQISEHRFRSMFDNHAAVMLVIDPASGAILDANPAAASYYGWTQEQLRRMRISDINVLDAAVCKQEMAKAANRTQSYFEFRHRRADGSVRDVAVFSSSIPDATRTVLHSVIQDITERKRQADIQHFLADVGATPSSEPFFTALARFLAGLLSADFVYVVRITEDGLKARPLVIWPSGGLDTTVEYLLQDTPCGAVLDKDVCSFPAGVCDRFPRAAQLRALGAEGYVGIALRNHDGRTIGVIAVVMRRPVTDAALVEATLMLVAGRAASEMERMAAEMELREKVQALARANEELKQAESRLVMQEKLASVGRLAAGVAHEINNPIGFLMNNFAALRDDVALFRDMLDSYGELCAKARRHSDLAGDVARLEAQANAAKLTFVLQDVNALFRESEDGFQRTVQILGSMRNFARCGECSARTPYSLNEAVRSTLVIARNEYKYLCDVEVEYGDMRPVICEPGKINQVVLNLLVNATQAIEGQQRREKGRITIRTRTDGDGVCCEIADDGPGIPAALQDKVFEPFFTTKPPGKGTGLGLSISYDIIVNQHGGSLTVDSREGCGATFRFSLPHLAPTAEAQERLNP